MLIRPAEIADDGSFPWLAVAMALTATAVLSVGVVAVRPASTMNS